MATTRKPVNTLAHAQRFWMSDSERTWVRITEADVERGCAVAPEVSRTTPDARQYYGLSIGRVHIILPETPVVPL